MRLRRDASAGLELTVNIIMESWFSKGAAELLCVGAGWQAEANMQ